jgi:hypothetical protein
VRYALHEMAKKLQHQLLLLLLKLALLLEFLKFFALSLSMASFAPGCPSSAALVRSAYLASAGLLIRTQNCNLELSHAHIDYEESCDSTQPTIP